MARITVEQRRAALRQRTERGVSERGQKGLGKKSVLDYSKAGNLKFVRYQMKSGKDTNYIDILPFEITQDWYKKLHSVSGSIIGLDIGFTDYKLEIPVHRSIGENNDIFLCLNKAFKQKCPICEEMFEEYAKDEGEQDLKKIQALKSSWRCFYNIYDYDGDGTTPTLWEDVSYYLFEEVLQEAMESEEEGIVTFSDPEMGSSIEFKGREKKLGKNPFIEAYSIVFKKRESYPDNIALQTFPLDKMLVIPTYEEVAKCHLGMEEEQEVIKQTESEPEQKSRTRSRFNEEKQPVKTKEVAAPWDDCPHGHEFGIDSNVKTECDTCDENLFQACAAKQSNLVKAGKEDVKEEEKSTTFRSRSRATAITGRTRQRGK
jgi:hypothetical protein